jgi:hypothetical protein
LQFLIAAGRAQRADHMLAARRQRELAYLMSII